FSWGDDCYFRKWDVATGKALVEYRLRPSGIQVPDEDADEHEREKFFSLGQAALAPDGRRFVLEAAGNYFVFDVATGKELKKIDHQGRNILSMALSPGGGRLLASSWGKYEQVKSDGATRFSVPREHPVRLWDLDSGEQVRVLNVPGEA